MPRQRAWSIPGTRIISFNPDGLGPLPEKVEAWRGSVSWPRARNREVGEPGSSPESTHLHATHHTASPGWDVTCGRMHTDDFYGQVEIIRTPQRGGQTWMVTCSFDGQVSMQPDWASPPTGSYTEAPKLEPSPGFPQLLPQSCVVTIHYMPILTLD